MTTSTQDITAQQIEDEAIEEIFQIIYHHDEYRDAAEALYRAGYRKECLGPGLCDDQGCPHHYAQEDR